MPFIKFEEIPPGNRQDGQDRFELFARDFFLSLGYKVSEQPARGPDQGKDMILIESRIGIGETIVRWLVSCKHYAKSTRAVGLEDETNLIERLNEHNCQGFLGFYSTLPSNALSNRLKTLTLAGGPVEIKVFDGESIERELLTPGPRMRLVERYFPESYARLQSENPVIPDLIALRVDGLYCRVCKKPLLGASVRDTSGIVTSWYSYDTETGETLVQHVVWSCDGQCDEQVQSAMRQKRPNLFDMWEPLESFCNPTIFASTLFGFLNELITGELHYTKRASSDFVKVLAETYSYVCRSLTESEKAEVHALQGMPRWLDPPKETK